MGTRDDIRCGAPVLADLAYWASLEAPEARVVKLLPVAALWLSTAAT